MLTLLAGFTVRRRRLVLGLSALAFALCVVVIATGGVTERLSSGGFEDPDAESTLVQELLQDEFGTGTPNVLLLVEARSGDVDAPEVAEAGRALAAELAGETIDGAGMSQVISYWDLPPDNPLGSTAGDKALVLALFPGDQNQLVELSSELTERYTRDDPAQPVSVRTGGFGPLFAEVNETIEADLVRAESIAFPLTLALLLLVFGGLVAASLPIVIGVLSIVGTIVALLVISGFTEVSVFALNLTTAMGLGLAIDYSLFVVSRFREERAAGHATPEAVRRTIQTAGKTVLFSALTVAASLCALLVFDIAFLRSFAYAGLAVSALAGVYAIVVLPAMLAALGDRIDSWSFRRPDRRTATADGDGGRAQRAGAQRPDENGVWHRVATFVMRRPVPVTAVVLVLLVFLGRPTLGLTLGFPDDRVLPEGKPARVVHDVIRAEFASEEAGALAVVATGIAGPAERAGSVDAWAVELAALPGVARVDAETGIYCGVGIATIAGFPCPAGGGRIPGSELLPTNAERFARPAATYVSVVPDVEPMSAEGEALVTAVRETASPFDGVAGAQVLVGGQSAQLVDSKASLFGDLPLALAIVAVITFVLLFLMFGSVVVPLKALVLNLLSLSATFGAMVWVFQDGNGAGLLGFTATGSLTATIPVLMFCVAFGLSMDYEVFLLSRIKEEHDHGADNVTSVARGLERTGRIVTAAAVLISVVFLAFATSEVSFIKLFGIGLTLAVLLDAFVIRGTLVPAFMRLAGEANWWAPAPLRRIHDRWGLSESSDLDEPAPVVEEPEEPDVDGSSREPVLAG